MACDVSPVAMFVFVFVFEQRVVEEKRMHFAARSIGYLGRILQTLNCISAQQHPPKPAQMHPDAAPRCIHEASNPDVAPRYIRERAPNNFLWVAVAMWDAHQLQLLQCHDAVFNCISDS